MEVGSDRLIQHLEDERAALLDRIAAVDSAIEALTGTRPATPNGVGRAKTSVGADRLEAVRKYIREHGEVRQADITSALDFNSGTVSTATHALMIAGEIERGPKRERSVTWRYVRQ